MKKIIALSWLLLFCGACMYAQNIGVGTSSPAAKLEIRHSSSLGSPTLTLYDNGVSNFSRLQFQNASGSKFWHIAGFIDDAADANSRLNFFHSVNGDVLSITGDKKVGIGITNPAFSLDVLGRMRVKTGIVGNIFTTPGIWLEDYRDGSNRIFFGMQDSIRVGFYGEGIPGVGWGFNFNARNGRVGIGTANPSALLDVNGTINAANFSYSTPKTQFYTVGGQDFRSSDSRETSVVAYLLGSVYMLNASQGLVAPVHLPQGATIISFNVYYRDISSTENLDVQLFKSDGYFVGGAIAEIISSGTPGNSLLADISITSPVVDNTSDTYWVRAFSSTGTWTSSDLQIARVQINYTIASPD